MEAPHSDQEVGQHEEGDQATTLLPGGGGSEQNTFHAVLARRKWESVGMMALSFAGIPLAVMLAMADMKLLAYGLVVLQLALGFKWQQGFALELLHCEETAAGACREVRDTSTWGTTRSRCSVSR